jgi:hypothetical protein
MTNNRISLARVHPPHALRKLGIGFNSVVTVTGPSSAFGVNGNS